MERPRAVAATLAAIFLPGGGHFLLGLWRRALVLVFIEGLIWYATALSMLLVWPGTVWVSWPLFLAVRVFANIDIRRHWPSQVPSLGPGLAAIAALFVLGTFEARTIRATLVEFFKIPSGGMVPTLQVGDHVVVDKRGYRAARGDLIVFKYPKEPDKDFIKRVIGIGGDTIEIRDGRLHINGQAVARKPVDGRCEYDDFDELAGRWETRSCTEIEETLDGRSWRIVEDGRLGGPSGPWTVPTGSLFVMGDNRDNSHDSRYWGFVPADHVRGRAVSVWWSQGPDGVRYERMNLRLR